MQNKIHILVMESFDLVRMGLCSFFENHPAVNLVAATNRMEDLPLLVRQHQPDVILMDLQLIDDHGAEILSGLYHQNRKIKVLILKSNEEQQLPAQMLPPATAGIISKHSSCTLLLHVITTIYAGKSSLSYSTLPVEQVKTGLATPPFSDSHPSADYLKLSRTENRIAYLACKGLPAKEIGRQLSITEKSVRNQLSSIYKKVGVRKQIQLCIRAPLHNYFQ